MASRLRVVRRGADAADDLYTAPPSDFTRIRDALVRKLRSAGQESIADAVRQRRKPTVSVWALNQAARTAPAHVQTLLSQRTRIHHERRKLNSLFQEQYYKPVLSKQFALLCRVGLCHAY